MKAHWLAWRNLRGSGVQHLISVLLLAFGIALIAFISALGNQLEQHLNQNLRGIDLVVGAKGSPLQLMLSAVYHVDVPTGNIDEKALLNLEKHPFVAYLVPLAYGDTHKGYRIIGSDKRFVTHYDLTPGVGTLADETYEVTLGAYVAERTGLTVGSTFKGSHGLVNEGMEHEHESFRVVGIFLPSGSVADQLIYTPTSSVWEIHHAKPPYELTAGLIAFKSPMAMMQLPRMINKETQMMAALPVNEFSRLRKFLGFGESTLFTIAALILLLAAAGVFASLYASMRSRRPQMATLRLYGASHKQLTKLAMFEGLYLTLSGWLIGIVISRLALGLVSSWSSDRLFYAVALTEWHTTDVYLLFGACTLGAVAALVSAWQLKNLDLGNEL